MYILVAYKEYTNSNYPNIYIIGMYPTLKKASLMQEKLSGKIKKIHNSWYGKDNICSWIHKLDSGTLEKALNIRDTNNAIFCPKDM